MSKHLVTSWAAATALLALLLTLSYTPANPAPFSYTQENTALASFPVAPEDILSQSDPMKKEAAPSLSAPESTLMDTSAREIRSTVSAEGNQVSRVQNPYNSEALSFEVVNESARNTLVNILCVTPHSSFNPVSGSGVIIDPRGVILTNAHVAQYVLLQDASSLSLDCSVRQGSPARPIGTPHILFISSTWIEEHAKDITTAHPTGTGENDVALLYFQPTVPVHTASIETREGATFESDPVVVASYPAGFVRGILIQKDLFLSSTITNIQKLYTFTAGTIDLYSLGGIILAQSGSSGGGVFNQWNKLVGLVVTSSEGATTQERDLRALSTSYIDRVIREETGESIETLLQKDPIIQSTIFIKNSTPELAQKLTDVILGN